MICFTLIINWGEGTSKNIKDYVTMLKELYCRQTDQATVTTCKVDVLALPKCNTDSKSIIVQIR